MKYNRAKLEIPQNYPYYKKQAVYYIVKKIEEESKKNGAYRSVEDFIQRMLAANLDIHAFSIIAEHIPMEFPNNGNSTMLRPVLALMGYDPDYTVLPEVVEPYDEFDEMLPFN